MTLFKFSVIIFYYYHGVALKVCQHVFIICIKYWMIWQCLWCRNGSAETPTPICPGTETVSAKTVAPVSLSTCWVCQWKSFESLSAFIKLLLKLVVVHLWITLKIISMTVHGSPEFYIPEFVIRVTSVASCW